jgi:Asp-tRNA(Asn)/Glu-tRNA(Gln) amidotransferase A subunit family amidase
VAVLVTQLILQLQLTVVNMARTDREVVQTHLVVEVVAQEVPDQTDLEIPIPVTLEARAVVQGLLVYMVQVAPEVQEEVEEVEEVQQTMAKQVVQAGLEVVVELPAPAKAVL